MLRNLLIFILLSSTAAAQSNISITFTPAFEPLNREPLLIVAYENTGSEPIYNLSSIINTSGLDMSRKSFFNSNDFYAPYIAPGERGYLSMQFEFPETRDDITVRTVTEYEQGGNENSIEIGFTVPAVLFTLSSEIPTAVFPILLLIALTVFYCLKKKE